MTTRENSKVEYYDPTTALRYNPLWLFVLSSRSVGKSFSFKKLAINTPNLITIWLRRTDTQRKDVKNWRSFISPLLNAGVIDEQSDYDLTMDGIRVDGVQKVIHSALSVDSGAHSMEFVPDVGYVQNKAKFKKQLDKKRKENAENLRGENNSATVGLDERVKEAILDSVDKAESQYDRKERPKIKKRIVYEEFLEPSGKYLKDEIVQLFEFYMTVDRFTNTQLVGLGNNMSNENIYYDYFGIRPFTQEFKWFKNKTLLVQNVKLAGMADFVKEQRFYNLVEGTDYADYLTDNKAWQDDYAFIEEKPKEAMLVFNLKFYNKIYGCWKYGDKLYVSSKANKNGTMFAGLCSITNETDFPFAKGTYIFKNIMSYMDTGRIRYESIAIRDLIYDMVNGGYKNA